MLQLWQPIFKMGGQRLHTYIFTLIFIVWNRSLHNSLLPANSEKKWEKNSKSTLAFSEGNYLGFLFLIMIFLVMIWKAEIHRLINRIVKLWKQTSKNPPTDRSQLFFLPVAYPANSSCDTKMNDHFLYWMNEHQAAAFTQTSVLPGSPSQEVVWNEKEGKAVYTIWKSPIW